MRIRTAALDDLEILTKYDVHIRRKELENIINLERVYIVEENGRFMGYGKYLVEHWEAQMKEQNYDVNDGIRMTKKLSMTPEHMVNQLTGFDRAFFKAMFAGKAADKIYRMYEYEMR